MAFIPTLALGIIAGSTIVFGLPLGRLSHPARSVRALLNAVSAGVLVFLLWDVLTAAWEPINSALSDLHSGGKDWAELAVYGSVYTAGLAAGLLGLTAYESWMRGRRSTRPLGPGPGAMAAGELGAAGPGTLASARRLALLIATGIGLHNFAEGLAIGQAAASGQVTLATLIVVGFSLHNATEGFGIVAPLAADADSPRPTWAFLGMLGLIGGGPTFLGTMAGQVFTSDITSIAFLTLAAGSILYVIIQLITIGAKGDRPHLLAYGILIGFLAGLVTDALIIAAGI